ncbi:hypothetical protein [Enterococcus sp. AZ072]|uniref:hypothetical protein n=1 Tax=unclassified Enterococcus TaxID=2608891 RepID=UPI003D26654D
MLKNIKDEIDKGMPVITYIKKKYGFNSIEEFEAYIKLLEEKSNKYDDLKKGNN